MQTQVCMIAYTHYSSDPRVIREAEALASLDDYNVTFLLPMEGEKPRNYVTNNVNVKELNTRTYRGKNKKAYLLSYFLFFFKAFLASSILFFKGKVDIFHVHNMPDCLVFSAIIPRLFGKKIILDVHDTMPETYATKFGEKSNLLFKLLCFEEALSCKISHKIICVNHPQSEVMIKRGIPQKKIMICMNVPDPKLFNPSNLKKNIPNSSGFKLVYHGTLAKRLGVDFIIQAVAKLVHQIPDLEFYLIGTGDDKEEFVSLSKSLNLDGHVKFQKVVPVKEIPNMICGMDVGVIANRLSVACELMLPVKLMEYIGLGIPVIVPRLKTIQYYFSENMVSYFEPENIDSLAEAILRLYNDGNKRKTQVEKAMKFIDKYGWEHHQLDLFNLYRELRR